MKRLTLICLLLAVMLVLSGCAAIHITKEVLETEEAREAIASGWEALTDGLNGGLHVGGDAGSEPTEEFGRDTGRGVKDGFALGGASLPVDGIREIEIEWIAGEVEIECYDGSEIVFSETSAEQLSERQTMRYLVKDGELEIRCCESKTVQLPEKTLTVQIPASLIADELEADVVSASLTARGVQAREIKLESVSGNICADGLTAEKLQIDTVSGIAEILRCDVARKLKIDTVSG
ncbi:MAG: DUF4097 family beta strand repeat-containing protein, partial [Christensenellales bacterium]